MSVLPEVSDIPALSVDYFPTPWQAALFRCWGRPGGPIRCGRPGGILR